MSVLSVFLTATCAVLMHVAAFPGGWGRGVDATLGGEGGGQCVAVETPPDDDEARDMTMRRAVVTCSGPVCALHHLVHLHFDAPTRSPFIL
jgi:hypothetical protein